MSLGSRCPYCRETQIVVELDGIEIDHCLSCHGTWFDAGELELLTERVAGHESRLHRELQAARPIERARLRCPRCGRRMDRIALGPSPGILIQRCRRGHGVSLAAAELAEMVKIYGGGPDGALANFCGNLVKHHLRQHASGEPL